MRVYLLGRVMIETDDDVLQASSFPGRQGRLLFVYLASAPRRVERSHLAETLWPEGMPDAWETSLNALISKLRRMLTRAGLDGAAALETGSGEVELRMPAGTWVDLRTAINELDAAEGALRRSDAVTAWSGAAVASAILRRSFLPGETGPWVDQMRRELHQYAWRAYDTLAAAWLLSGDTTSAMSAARRSVELSPYRESSYARLMECHIAAGNRAEALQTYRELTDLLRDSMGISPGREVETLYLEALD